MGGPGVESSNDRTAMDSAAAKGHRVLFVDDDHGSRAHFLRAMGACGFVVDAVSNGADALVQFGKTQYDAVVTDLYMPGLSGLQVAAHLESVAPHIPVILVTGDTDADLSSRSSTNIATLIFKPWNDRELANTLTWAITKPSVTTSLIPDPDGATRILVVEDNPGDADLVEIQLKRSSLKSPEIVCVETVAEALRELGKEAFSAVLLDLSLPDARGMEAVNQVTTLCAGTPVIVFTGTDDENVAALALQAGAQDYVVKGDLDASALERTLRRAMDRKRAERRLRHLLEYDQVTGLANRAVFHERLDRVLARCRRTEKTTGVFYIDLDRFKAVNDTSGHHVGDRLLHAVGRALRRGVRDFDVVGRLGGDEFGVVVDEIRDEHDASIIADRLLRHIAEATEEELGSSTVSASMGIAIFPDNGDNVQDLMRSADSAMYLAKREGCGYRFYSAEMHERELRRAAQESDLRNAALDKDLNFEVHYQPQYALSTGRLVGAEALMRMRRGVKGHMFPNEFIPLLESLRLIDEMGNWILHTACQQARQWQQALADPFRIAVNLSTVQFRDPAIVTEIESTLAKTGMPPANLELEITEGALIENVEKTQSVLNQLKHEVGVRLAIDDFGTGYSSLAYLKQFPIDVLKIDGLFLRDLESVESQSIVQGIVALGHGLGLETVAECVETTAQEELLRQMGCDVEQGYLRGKPMSAEDFSALVKRCGRAIKT